MVDQKLGAQAALLPQRLISHARLRGEQDAVVFIVEHAAEQTLSYRQLAGAAITVADRISRLGQRGKPVLLMQPTGTEFIASMLGCMLAGAIAVPLPSPGRYARQWGRSTRVAADSGAQLVLVDRDHVEEVYSWAKSIANSRPAVFDISDDVTAGALLRESELSDSPHVDGVTPEAVGFLQYTSGSTGTPKGVVITQRNLAAYVGQATRALGLDERDRFCSWLPVHHDFGLIGMLLVPLSLGATTFLMSPTHFVKHPAAWLRMLSDRRATITAAPNFGHNHCLDRARHDQLVDVDLGGLRWLLNGSEPVDARTLQRFAETYAAYGLKPETLGPCYGLAEATLGVSYPVADFRAPVLPLRRTALAAGRVERAVDGHEIDVVDIVSCGVPQGVELVIVDQFDNAVGEGQVGEIWVRGDSVSSEYWGRSEETRHVLRACLGDGSGPWLRTGDLGLLEDGHLYVTGRLKEMLIINGRNLYPHDLERELQQTHPALAGRPGCIIADENDALVAIFEHDPRIKGAISIVEELIAALARRLAELSGAAVADVHLVPPGQVRRTTSGKIQRALTGIAMRGGELIVTRSLSTDALPTPVDTAADVLTTS